MLQRSEFWLVLAVSAGIIGAALVGQWTAPSGELLDFRRSANLAGPGGARGLAEVLERLDVEVELRQQPLFDLASDSSTAGVGDLILLLDVTLQLTGVETRELRHAVARGRSLLIAGESDVERCFGFRTVFVEDYDVDTSTTLVRPVGIDTLPEVDHVVEPIPSDSLYVGDESSEACPVLLPTRVDTLLTTVDGRVAGLKLRFRKGSTVTILADSWLVSNESLKETDAGPVIVGWILDGNPRRVVIDEYHHGFQDRRSIFTAAWRWALASPAGWTILQLSIAALAALALMAVRFGPALNVVERRRRSAIEHLDALAVGLERASGRDVAVELIAGGLRRRLTRTVTTGRDRDGIGDWLARLGLAVHTPGARKNLKRLAWLVREPGGDDDVLDAAIAVEDVWQALGQRSRPN
ncbi:MAG: DUF4350 domain-containing protein [Gemmatimonadales bacterium]|jgi:hypothetical protein